MSNDPSERPALTHRFDRHLLACAAMAGAAWSGSPVQAEIISTTGVSYPVMFPYARGIDFDSDGSYDIIFGFGSGTYGYTYAGGGGGALLNGAKPAYGIFGWTDNIAAGTSIDSSGTFDIYAHSLMYRLSKPRYGEFGDTDGGPEIGKSTGNYVGVRFYSSIDYAFHYGWVGLDLSGSTRTITGFAYETAAGTAILAGATAAVPEPASASLIALAMGTAGVLRRRRNGSAPSA